MRPLLLDLFCGAGGAAVGYHQAGFDVVGVDIAPQPRYPFPFIQGDALEPPVALSRFDAIHASPPCQAYARVTAWRGDRASHPDLVPPTRMMLWETSTPFVIENVRESGLIAGLMLCGSMFGLQVRRHRYFETNFPMWGRPCGSHRGLLSFEHKQERAYGDAMGCDWMVRDEHREAIPPAYTEFIGSQLIEHLERVA